VVDGSQEPRNQIDTKRAVSAIAAATGHHAEYVGPGEAAEFRAKLASTAPAARLLSLGSAGANRNLLLLLTAGENILAIDDDVLCETWTPGGQGDSLAVTGHRQARIITRFFPTRTAAFDAAHRHPANLLAAHEQLLGRELAVLIGGSPHADLSEACSHVRTGLLKNQPLNVTATFSGIAGDAGTYCPYRLLFAPVPLRDQLCADGATFATAMASREVIRIAASAIVTHDCSCMATCMGLSNRTVLPPFPPRGRNEDGVFGIMLAASRPSTLFGHIPVGVLHDSARPSRRLANRIVSATESRLSDLLISVVRLCPSTTGQEPGAWTLSMSRVLAGLGSMTRGALVDLVTDLTLEERRREMAHTDEAASDPRCPDFWRAALTEYRAQLASSISRPDFPLPCEFHDAGGGRSGFQALQTFLASFGELAEGWTALWETARTMNTAHRVA